MITWEFFSKRSTIHYLGSGCKLREEEDGEGKEGLEELGREQ